MVRTKIRGWRSSPRGPSSIQASQARSILHGRKEEEGEEEEEEQEKEEEEVDYE